VEQSSGTHIFELHMPTMGFGAVSFGLIVGGVILLLVCIRKCFGGKLLSPRQPRRDPAGAHEKAGAIPMMPMGQYASPLNPFGRQPQFWPAASPAFEYAQRYMPEQGRRPLAPSASNRMVDVTDEDQRPDTPQPVAPPRGAQALPMGALP
jgi:hypothetical protein